VAYFHAKSGKSKGGEDMKRENYKIPNQSSAMVKAPQTIIKDSKKPKVVKGGDLRAKGN
jgi:hypothetical protein